MALEPAGVSLQAQGFAQYIKRLDQIDKAQQKIFNVVSQKTGKTYDEVAKAARKYEAEQRRVIAAEKAAQQEADKLAAAQKTAAATQTQAFISVTQAALRYAQQIVKVAFELGKLGAQYDAQKRGLNNLAASFGQSGTAIQKSIVAASKGTISDLKALQVANEGLLLGVARTPEEFAKFTQAALTLGRTVGISASESINRFTTALGRESLLRLDDFGAKASEVNAEIERIARSQFGKLPSELSKAERSAAFIEAALNVTSGSVEKIGEDSAAAAESFDRLAASADNLKSEVGLALSDLNQSLGITKTITSEINQITQAIRASRGGREDATLDEQIEATEIKIKNLQKTLEDTRADFQEGGGLFGTGLFEDFFASLSTGAIEKQTESLGKLQAQLEDLKLQKSAEDQKKFNDEQSNTPPIVEDNTKAIKAYEAALRQAQELQLSFARAAEDAAIKQARALEDLNRKQARINEDTARKEAQQIGKLQESQAKDREKLLKDQQKELDRFEKDRRKQIANAEGEIRKERQAAAEQRKRDQDKLNRELQRAQERFNLDQLQSERRFRLQESRLIAEGDVIGLKELREDFALQQQEEKENFALSQKEQKSDAIVQQREQTKDLEDRIKDLKSNLEERRAELLANFDEQLRDQEEAQAEQKAELLRGFEEQAIERSIAAQREEEDRQIALQRAEEDRRLSQQRQLEDLGRSFADQEEITAEGAATIAAELEKVFGIDGSADTIMTGFTSKTEGEFRQLFDNIENIIKGADLKPEPVSLPIRPVQTPGLGVGTQPGRIGGVQEFDTGGIVGGSGPIGSPQLVMAHKGETAFAPTHKSSYQMTAPVIPSQSLNVNMSGGFSITGDGQANEAILQQATAEMTENIRIAVERLARRN